MSMIRSRRFWDEAFALRGSISLRVLPRVFVFGALAGLICLANRLVQPELGIEVGPHEVAGGVLGLLLVFRTNSGYDRWWEARKLWGGIVNQCRNLAAAALAYGPADPAWRERFVRRAAAFPHVARASLRGERELPEVADLLGPEETARIAAAGHMPGRVALDLADLLREALDRGMDPRAFQQADRERALLIEHIGGCERIQKTPLPAVYAIIIRRFITLYLATLPFALMLKITWWQTVLVTTFVAYPILSLDQVGVELQDPFSARRLSHLPLAKICRTIEANLLESLGTKPPAPEEV